MTTKQTAEAIAQFARNLDNACDMGDRKNAVQWLAEKIGSKGANEIAEIFGLSSSYYKA